MENKTLDSAASEGVPPERVKLVIRAATTDDWIGVAYCKDYAGDPSTIHEYVRASSVDEAAVRRAARMIEIEFPSLPNYAANRIAEIISTELALDSGKVER